MGGRYGRCRTIGAFTVATAIALAACGGGGGDGRSASSLTRRSTTTTKPESELVTCEGGGALDAPPCVEDLLRAGDDTTTTTRRAAGGGVAQQSEGSSRRTVGSIPPDVARRLTQQLVARQRAIYVEDYVVAGLLWYQYRTGVVPVSAADAALTREQSKMYPYRVRAYRDFWYRMSGVDWRKYPMQSTSDLESWWSTYLDTKVTYRLNAQNQQMAAIVGSDTAWRNAMDSVRRWENRLYTSKQVADAEYDGWHTILLSEQAIQAAANALG